MRAGKQGDSPCEYPRDVYPLRAAKRPARSWPEGELGDALHAVAVRWAALHAEGGECPSSWESDRLAAKLYGLGHLVSLVDAPESRARVFELAAVYALAGLVRADAAAVLDPSSGQDAAA